MKLLLLFILSILTMSAKSQNNPNSENTSVTRLEYPSNFSELIEPFKGKVIYVDVMASWCKPCLEELKHYKELDDFFAEKDIIKLFITIDNPEDIDKSLQLLNKNNIKGNFISYHSPQKDANKGGDYTKVVEKMFVTYDKEGNFAGMSVPQYVIIDRNGDIVEYKAERPTNTEKLKEQLSFYLDN